MAGFRCATCGEWHDSLPMCFGAPAPELWLQLTDAERNTRGELSSDQCAIDEHRFVLGRILIPVVDGTEPFIWLAWVSLSEKNFDRMSELWETPGRETEPPYFGWLQSALRYEPTTINLKALVHTQPVGERPIIEVEPTDHPLSIAQRFGMTRNEVESLVAQLLHGR